MHCMVCKFEKWRSSYGKKYLRPFFVHGCHWNTEIHMHTKFHFHALHGLQVWEVKKQLKEKSDWGHFCSWLSWKRWNTHVYQVSPPRIVWCASLRSEEVVTGKSAWGNILSMVVMETLKYTCVPSFSSMHCMVCKFEKWRSSYREKCLREFFCWWLSWKQWNTYAHSFISMCTIVGKFEKWRSDFKENCLRLFVVGCCHGNHFCVMGVT